LDGIAEETVKEMKGTDFLGIDYYSRYRVKFKENEMTAGIPGMTVEPCINCSDFGWDIFPEGLRKTLSWLYGNYKLPLYILENGIADSADSNRSMFITDHLRELAVSINSDRIPVKGYFHWSLLDNFEWAKGFSMRFGLYAVDYVTRERRMRKSAEVYEEICRRGWIVE
ncbi:beta-glucosidase, partial [mine drainage metagenome]